MGFRQSFVSISGDARAAEYLSRCILSNFKGETKKLALMGNGLKGLSKGARLADRG